jgi:transposase
LLLRCLLSVWGNLRCPIEAAVLLALLERWQAEGVKAARPGRDGFWLARRLRKRGVESHVIHSTSVPVSREHRRAKSDRLDLAILLRVFLGWPRGECKHCSMVAIPRLEQEDAKRPSRERESLTGEKTRIVNLMKGRWHGLAAAASSRSYARRPKAGGAQHAEGVAPPTLWPRSSAI